MGKSTLMENPTGFLSAQTMLFLPSVAHAFWSLLDIWHTFQSPFWLQARPERVPQRTKRVATAQWPENGCSVPVWVCPSAVECSQLPAHSPWSVLHLVLIPWSQPRPFEVVVGLMKVIHTQLMQPCQRLQDCQLQQKHRTCQVASNVCCSWFSHSRCRTSCYSNRWMCSGSKHRHPRHTTIQKTCSALSILRSNLFWRSGPVTIAMLCNSMSHKPICSRSIKTLQCLVNFTSSSKMKAPEVGSGLRLSKPTPRSWPQLRLCLKKVRGTCTELTLQVRSTLRQHSERWDAGMLRNATALCLLTSDSAQLSLRKKSTQQSNSSFLKIVFFVGSRSMAIWWARRPRLGCKNNLRCLLNWSSEQSIRRPCPSRRRTRNPNRRERMNLQKLKPSSGLWTSISF